MNHHQNKNSSIDFSAEMESAAQLVNKLLADALNTRVDLNPRIKQAMEYTLLGGGKRLRGAIVLWCCRLITGDANDAARAGAVAVEMVHAYSLIHDDLPAMDDDDLRRGKPTCHKAFDEATAILAGDGLLTMAFEILAEISEPHIAVRMMHTLAAAAGPAGMIAGQMDDMLSEKMTGSPHMLQQIHLNKTAKMFSAAAAMGAVSGGADDTQTSLLIEYGLKLGLGFQISDDILDVSSSTETLGKTVGKDQAVGKMTYPSVLGMEKSLQVASDMTDQAIKSLQSFNGRAAILRQLALELKKRTS